MLNGKLNLCILISGGGTTMQAVLRACKGGRLPHINPALIISSSPDAGGIAKAKAAGVLDKNIKVIVRKNFPTREAFGEAINREILIRRIDCVFQCGWIPRTPDNVIEACGDMIHNQHAGPLDNGRPDFGGIGMRGLATHEAVLQFVKKIERPFRAEATVHRVISGLDLGAIVGLHPVEIMAGDDAHKLAARVLPHEHGLVIDVMFQLSMFGRLLPMRRKLPLILPEEIPILAAAKTAAVAAFPNG